MVYHEAKEVLLDLLRGRVMPDLSMIESCKAAVAGQADCEACGGVGVVAAHVLDFSDQGRCDHCDGTGGVPACPGSGTMAVKGAHAWRCPHCPRMVTLDVGGQLHIHPRVRAIVGAMQPGGSCPVCVGDPHCTDTCHCSCHETIDLPTWTDAF